MAATATSGNLEYALSQQCGSRPKLWHIYNASFIKCADEDSLLEVRRRSLLCCLSQFPFPCYVTDYRSVSIYPSLLNCIVPLQSGMKGVGVCSREEVHQSHQGETMVMSGETMVTIGEEVHHHHILPPFSSASSSFSSDVGRPPWLRNRIVLRRHSWRWVHYPT